MSVWFGGMPGDGISSEDCVLSNKNGGLSINPFSSTNGLDILSS